MYICVNIYIYTYIYIYIFIYLQSHLAMTRVFTRLRNVDATGRQHCRKHLQDRHPARGGVLGSRLHLRRTDRRGKRAVQGLVAALCHRGRQGREEASGAPVLDASHHDREVRGEHGDLSEEPRDAQAGLGRHLMAHSPGQEHAGHQCWRRSRFVPACRSHCGAGVSGARAGRQACPQLISRRRYILMARGKPMDWEMVLEHS